MGKAEGGPRQGEGQADVPNVQGAGRHKHMTAGVCVTNCTYTRTYVRTYTQRDLQVNNTIRGTIFNTFGGFWHNATLATQIYTFN